MSRTRKVSRSTLTGCLLLALTACGPRFDGSLLRRSDVSYRVGPLPSDYRRVEVEDNDLAFYKHGAGSIAANATCRDYDDVPHVALLNHLLFGTTRRDFKVDEEVTLDGRGARHAVVEAELDGVPVRLEVYLLTRANCVFDLSYVSDRAARGQRDFDAFVRGFAVVSVDP